jgi:hypothetical protein
VTDEQKEGLGLIFQGMAKLGWSAAVPGSDGDTSLPGMILGRLPFVQATVGLLKECVPEIEYTVLKRPQAS